ncbi:MAG: Flp family type IVb pilin [Clostridia bacterium]|nr:Flp family type IVb pilin [Clostridia bacterium]
MEESTMLRNWLMDEDGQGMVEYGLIIALIALVVIAALVLLGPKVKEIFDKTNDALDTAEPAG